MLESLIHYLEEQQSDGSDGIPLGNYPSYRYHRLSGLRRKEDNVYFVAWINQVLRRNLDLFEEPFLSRVKQLLNQGDGAIEKYRNRYQDISYNFYRPDSWFPNGRILSRFGRFQPTDDSDDTSMALRGMVHDKSYAYQIKQIYREEANGRHGRWLKRTPKTYRRIQAYNTWIGSKKLYADVDVLVLCNILMFNATYDLGIQENDESSMDFIIKAALSGDLLKKKWSLSAWYPFDSVILYGLADLLSLGYYSRLEEIKPWLINELVKAERRAKGFDAVLVSTSLLRLGHESSSTFENQEVKNFIDSTSSFSYGVIPLTHPWNGLLSQWLSSFKLFRLHYDCPAHRAAILLEHILLLEKMQRQSEVTPQLRKKEQDPVSRIL